MTLSLHQGERTAVLKAPGLGWKLGEEGIPGRSQPGCGCVLSSVDEHILEEPGNTALPSSAHLPHLTWLKACTWEDSGEHHVPRDPGASPSAECCIFLSLCFTLCREGWQPLQPGKEFTQSLGNISLLQNAAGWWGGTHLPRTPFLSAKQGQHCPGGVPS